MAGVVVAGALVVGAAPATAAPVSTVPFDRGMARVCEAGGSGAFDDVQGNAHRDAIECLSSHGLTQGLAEGGYGPRGVVRRDQMASFVVRLVERVSDERMPAGQVGRFGDADRFAAAHGEAIGKLAAAGIVDGHADGTFRPDEPVSRQQVASFLRRAISYVDAGRVSPAAAPPAWTGGPIFADGPFVAAHGGNIDALAGVGIVQGDRSGAFRPGASVSRDAMASLVMRTYDYLMSDELVALDPSDPGRGSDTDEPDDEKGDSGDDEKGDEGGPSPEVVPFLESTMPADGATSVSPHVTVYAFYDQDLENGQIDLVCDDAPVEGIADVKDGAVSLSVNDPVPHEAECVATVVATGTNGLAAEPVTFGFTITPPTPWVSSTEPAWGEAREQVSVDLPEVAATFDEALADGSTASVVCDEEQIEGESSLTDDDRRVTFVPAGPLPYDARCTARFEVISARGASITTTFTFTTELEPKGPPGVDNVDQGTNYSTVTDAVAHARPGDRLEVHAQEDPFDEGVVAVDVEGLSIVGIDQPVLHGTLLVGADGVTISGLEFANWINDRPFRSAAIEFAHDGAEAVTISGNTFVDAEPDRIAIWAMMGRVSGSVSDNVFTDVDIAMSFGSGTGDEVLEVVGNLFERGSFGFGGGAGTLFQDNDFVGQTETGLYLAGSRLWDATITGNRFHAGPEPSSAIASDGDWNMQMFHDDNEFHPGALTVSVDQAARQIRFE